MARRALLHRPGGEHRQSQQRQPAAEHGQPGDDQSYGKAGEVAVVRRADRRDYRQDRRYYNQRYNDRNYRQCDNGTGGTIIGAIAGGLAGHEIAGRGDRTVGTIIGGAVGAIAGRAILIEGEPGTGKTSLALALIDRGATLIGDDGVARGSALPYQAPNRQTRFALTRLPVLTGPWRGLGAGPNGLAIESAIDECARATGDDPVAFRLRHMAEPRLARTLKTAVDAAPPKPTAPRTGRGVACGTYKQHSHAAVVADVRVEPDGTVHVIHLTCAHDCGRVIHPDQVKAQCEGNLVWGIGMALSDQLSFADGRVDSDSFARVPLPRMGDVPPMRVVLVDEGEAPGGAGETAIVAAAAAIANAVRDATGRRPTRFHVDPADFAQT